MVNGRPRGTFKSSQGLRQEDPLSPFLFVLCADTLSRLFEKATKKEVCKSMSVGRANLEISYLHFTNDTILFSNGIEIEANT